MMDGMRLKTNEKWFCSSISQMCELDCQFDHYQNINVFCFDLSLFISSTSNGKVYVAQVKRRTDARKIYDTAKKQGKTAGLVATKSVQILFNTFSTGTCVWQNPLVQPSTKNYKRLFHLLFSSDPTNMLFWTWMLTKIPTLFLIHFQMFQTINILCWIILKVNQIHFQLKHYLITHGQTLCSIYYEELEPDSFLLYSKGNVR